jgi:hypothetical protein
MNPRSPIVRESIRDSVEAVEALAQCIARLKGSMRAAAMADAHRAFGQAAAKLDIGPDATFLWKEAHVAALRRRVEEIDRG